MKRTLLMTVAGAALIAGAGLASAQDKQQMPRTGGGTAPPPAAQQSAPAEKSAAPMTQGQGTSGQGSSTQGAGPADSKMDAKPPRAAQDKSMDRPRNVQDKSGPMNKNVQTPDSKASTTTKSSTDTKATTGTKSSTDTKASGTSTSSDTKAGSSTTQSSGSTTTERSTTGQGAAGTSGSVNLSTEQRTRITSVIKQQNVKPLTNVNFSISVGTRVPRNVHFYPLPVTVIEVYPEWRGFMYVLVGDQILVIHPRTHEIVAVLEA